MDKLLAKGVFTDEHFKKKWSTHTTYDGEEVVLEKELYAGLKVQVEGVDYDLELVISADKTKNGATTFGQLVVNGWPQTIFENETKAKANSAYATKGWVMRSGNLIGVKVGDDRYINPYKFYIRSVPTTKDKKEYHVDIKTNDYKGDYTEYVQNKGTWPATPAGATSDDDLPF